MGRIKDDERQYNYIVLAENFYLDNKKEKAIRFYEKALEFKGTVDVYKTILYNIAQIYDEIDEKAKAIDYYYKVIELVQDDYITYNNIGSLYEEMGNYENALKMINKSLEIEPRFYKALFNMGVVYTRLNEYDIALDYYYKSIEINPKYAYSYLNISAIYIEQEKFKDTINLLDEGINNNPDAVDLYYNRACSYSILKDNKNAIKDLRKCIVLFPNIIESILVDKDFENLYDDVEFINLTKQIIKKIK